MKRDIKFRVWLKALERFLTKDEWVLDFDGNLYFKDYNIGENEWATEFLDLVLKENYIVQQFTGLVDKNGQEIYEGDFIKYEHPTDEQCVARNTKNIVLVRWTEEHEDNYPGFRIVDLWGQYGEMEVVGNINENPKLLK